MAGCRSHKETDMRVAETHVTQAAETAQLRTDCHEEIQYTQAERADSIAWTASADSVVQTQPDGSRRVLHRVRWTRTDYKPTATASVAASTQQRDTVSVSATAQTQEQTATHTHNESSRGGRPWWLLAALAVATVVAVVLVRRKILA